MKEQFDLRYFVIRERFKFWSDMNYKPGEIQELAAHIHQDATIYDFTIIRDPQDEALCTHFICSVNNEAVLKALFKVSDKLDFTCTIATVVETEDTTKVAKETIYGNKPKLVNKVKQQIKPYTAPQKTDKNTGSCCRCVKSNHNANQCYFKGIICKHQGSSGIYLPKKARTKYYKSVSRLILLKMAHTSDKSVPKLEVSIDISGETCVMEVDTATTGNFITRLLGRIGMSGTEQTILTV